MTTITIYHNPKCGTSRNTLAMIRNSGMEPEVIEYLKTPPDRATLVALIAATGEPVINAVRTKEAIFTELQLDAPGVTDAQLIDAMLQHPILITAPSWSRPWARGCAARPRRCWTSCPHRSKVPSPRRMAKSSSTRRASVPEATSRAPAMAHRAA
jgi:arsenate reductase (glutaredoxin)